MKISKESKNLGAWTVAAVVITMLLTLSFTGAASPSATMTITEDIYPGAPSYTVYEVGGTYYAKDQNGYNEFSGTTAKDVIQDAFDGLTSGRTWKETVALVGNILVEAEISVPSYTTLDIQGSLTANIPIDGAILLLDGVSDVGIIGGIVDGAAKATQCILMRDVERITVKTSIRNPVVAALYVMDDAQKIDIDVLVDGQSGNYGVRLYVFNDVAGYVRDVNVKAIINGTDEFGFWVGHAEGKPQPDNIHCDVIVNNAQLRGVGLSGKITGKITAFNCPNQDGIEIYDGVFNLQLTADYNGHNAMAENIIIGPDESYGYQHIEGIFVVCSTRSGRRGVSIQQTTNDSRIVLLGLVSDSHIDYEGVLLDSAYGVTVQVQSIGQNYGIREVNSSDYNIIVGCDCRNNTSDGVTTIGAHSIAANNLE